MAPGGACWAVHGCGQSSCSFYTGGCLFARGFRSRLGPQYEAVAAQEGPLSAPMPRSGDEVSAASAGHPQQREPGVRDEARPGLVEDQSSERTRRVPVGEGPHARVHRGVGEPDERKGERGGAGEHGGVGDKP